MANYKKAQKKPADASTAVVSIVDKIGPDTLLLGTLGAIAAKGGLIDPLTQMMMALSGGRSPIGDAIGDTYKAAYEIASPALLLYNNAGNIGTWLVEAAQYASGAAPTHRDGTPKTTAEKDADIKMYAIMASSAANYMIFYTFAKNPEFQKAMYSMMTGAGAGLSALVKAV